jgi:predicted metal-dependent hydrolase
VTGLDGAAATRSVRYGAAVIEFELVRADRETLEIAVLPDGAVLVKAPRSAREGAVLERVARRARWILRQQHYFAQFQPRTPMRRYVGGETHLYLGRQYRLAIVEGHDEGVRLVAGWFRVTVHPDQRSSLRVRRLLDRWYAEKATVRLTERFDDCWSRFPAEGRGRPSLRLRRMRTRWGSLSAAGTLSLHPDLVRAPKECIDYVIVHELCHLICPDHGREFRNLLERVLPDWERRKHRLELALA